MSHSASAHGRYCLDDRVRTISMEEVEAGSFRPFSFVWLEPAANGNTTHTTIIDAQLQCRTLVKQLKIFDIVADCEQYIQSECTKSKVILIINEHVSQMIVSRIHELPQVSAIYVYGMDTEENTGWLKSYSKVNLTSTITAPRSSQNVQHIKLVIILSSIIRDICQISFLIKGDVSAKTFLTER